MSKKKVVCLCHAFEINIETLETTSSKFEDDGEGWNGRMDGLDMYELVDYNEFGEDLVYVESRVSAQEAKRLVYAKCVELSDKFQKAAAKVLEEMSTEIDSNENNH